VGFGNFFFNGQQVRQGQLTPDIGNVNFDHKMGSFLLQILYHLYVTAKCPQTQGKREKVSKEFAIISGQLDKIV
jgi:hypothetical protein